jgi:Arc/MetJ-type ribon-helix-helix transcriptional regulator
VFKTLERYRISVQIEQDQREQIEARIKTEYPKLKNVSDVVRAALKEFLETAEPY